MKISKNKLITINKNLTLSVDMNRREVTRLSEELRVSRDSFNGLRNESFRVKSHNKDLSKDLAVYTQLCEMLSSELLSARLEI